MAYPTIPPTNLEIACQQIETTLSPFQPVWLQINHPFGAKAAEARLQVQHYFPNHPVGVVFNADQPQEYQLTAQPLSGVEERQQVYAPHQFDSVTGLRLSSILFEVIAKHLDADESFYVLISNLDHFQSVFSFYGKAATDYLLKTLARRFEERLPQAEAFYLMGGRCVFLVPYSACQLEELESLLNELAHQSVAWEDYLFHVTTTFGATLHNAESRHLQSVTAESLLCSAGLSLNKAKNIKSNSVFDLGEPHLKLEYGQRLRGSHLLVEAFKKQQIGVFFQPIYCNKTGRLISQECLARIKHPHGWVGADQFIAQASFLRLQGDLSIKVLEVACQAFSGRSQYFSVNIMPEDLLNERTLEALISVIEEHRLGPWITLELVESDHLVQLEAARQSLSRLKDLGCKLAIDDFGSGYANFNYLVQLQPQWIKLDGSLINHLAESVELRTIVGGIVDIADNLNIPTIAEYVHSAEVHSWVKRLGVTASQGFYLGCPRPEPW